MSSPFNIFLTILLLAILAAGCTKPTEVVVHPPDAEQDTPVDVIPLQTVDTATYQGGLESTAVTPDDQTRFLGLMLVTRTVFDRGSSVTTTASSTVVLTDNRFPLQVGGKTFGYRGIRLGRPLSINGILMTEGHYDLRVGGLPVQWGWAYHADLPGQDTTFTWRAVEDTGATVGPIGVTVHAPPPIAVTSPKGGGTYSRNSDLKLRWSGTGAMTIFVSEVFPALNLVVPVMELHPAKTGGPSMIPAKILQALPRHRFYVFTFVLADRNSSVTITGFRGAILAQASSVYNVYVELP